MELKTVSIEQIKPYKGNPRINEQAVEPVKESIRQCTYISPIVVDEKHTILAGHTRYKALKELGYTEVPVVIASGLTKEQKKKFRILDNKTAEFAEWDMELLKAEIEGLDFGDLDLGFDFSEPVGVALLDAEEEDDGYYGDERERTYEKVNLAEFDPYRAEGKWDIPILTATRHIPKDLISFNYVLNTDAFDKGVHFYIDDYQFERVWANPHQYIDRLRQFDCCLTPDFSMYLDMPLAMQLWNVYRSRLIGQIMQDNGIIVIPTLQWSDKRSYEFCFDGIEPGGVVSVSTIGVKKNPNQKRVWYDGMDEAMARINPRHVVVYGGDIGYKFHCGVSYISNHNAERLKE